MTHGGVFFLVSDAPSILNPLDNSPNALRLERKRLRMSLFSAKALKIIQVTHMNGSVMAGMDSSYLINLMQE